MSGGAKPRVGVVITELGLRSEIWAMRQIAHFERIEPVLFAWSAASLEDVPEGTETHLFSTPFARPVTPPVRLGWKLGLPASILPPRAWLADIRRTLLEARLEAVFAHFAWNAMRLVPAVGDRLPIAAQVHGRDVSKFLGNRAYRNALAAALPGLHHVAAVGSHQLARLAPLGLGPASVIPCGAPFAEFSARPLPERAEGAPIRFVSAGRLSAEKGVMETLAAFARVAEAEPAAELVMIGDGPLAAEAAAAAAPFGPRVRLAGRLAPAQVAEELAAGHVFVQHSRDADGWVEGFGVSIAEAGASGLALVASRTGGIPDQLRDGENGLLHAQGDVAAQAEAMLRLARDEPLRRRMGAEARRVAEGFDARAMSRRLEDVLLGAVAAGPRRAAA